MCVFDNKSRRIRYHNFVIFNIIIIFIFRRISTIQSIRFFFSIIWIKNATRDLSYCYVSSRLTFTKSLLSTTNQISISTFFYNKSSLNFSIFNVSLSMSIMMCISKNSTNIMFTYEIKRLKKIFEQKILNWFSISNKNDFDQY
jgi:hypothetical protein